MNIIKTLKRFIAFILINLRTKKITNVKQNNIEFTIETQDKLGEEWNLINEYDYSEFQIFKKINLEIIKKVYYFGAHQCVIPIKISKIFLPNSDFYCFEAIKKNHLVAQNNIKHNNCQEKVQIFNEAISTTNGYEYFDPISMNSYQTKKNIFSTKVKSSDLKSIINRFGKGELFYFDIEGLEGQVIEKSIKFLKSWKNSIFVESHGLDFMKRYNYSNKKLYELFRDNGYKFYKLRDDYHNNNEKFIEINNSDQIPEKRFYFFAHN